MKSRTKNSHKWQMIAFICFMAVAKSFAQEPPKKDLLQEFFFPPELVMKYQYEVQLKNEQKESIISSIEETQKKFNRLQWNVVV